jgi:hypothetical protein
MRDYEKVQHPSSPLAPAMDHAHRIKIGHVAEDLIVIIVKNMLFCIGSFRQFIYISGINRTAWRCGQVFHE